MDEWMLPGDERPEGFDALAGPLCRFNAALAEVVASGAPGSIRLDHFAVEDGEEGPVILTFDGGAEEDWADVVKEAREAAVALNAAVRAVEARGSYVTLAMAAGRLYLQAVSPRYGG
jgi:hypothetical protein